MKVFLKNKFFNLNFVLGLTIGLVLFLGLSVLLNNCSVFAYSLTVYSSGVQNIKVAPKNDGIGTSISTDNITVATDCRNGYDFAISTSVNDNNLYLDGDSDNNSSDTYFTPSNGSTVLNNAPNTWGYYFNASAPTTAPTSSSVFNPVPVVGSPISLISERTTPSSTDISDSFNIYYGVAVSNNMPVGDYKMTPDANNSNNTGVIVYHATMARSCIPYTVEFNPTSTAGGNTVSGTGVMSPQEIYKDTSVALTTNGFTAPFGYEFKEWNTAQDGTGTSYTDEESVTNLATPGNTITLYAQWEFQPTLYNLVAIQSKGKNTDSESHFSLETITTPTSTDPSTDTSSSGVFEWDGMTTGNGVDSNGGNEKIYFYRGILDTTVATYGSDGLADAYPNYVKLDNNTCWRIVRTTSTGGVKMIYNGIYGDTVAGSCANSTTKAQTRYNNADLTVPFNITSGTYAGKTYTGLGERNIHAVGYTYTSNVSAGDTTTKTPAQLFGTSGNDTTTNNMSSVMKQYIEDWYGVNMTDYTTILEGDAGYCQDRRLNTDTRWTTPLAEDSSVIVPYGTSGMTTYYFGAFPRTASGPPAYDPLFTCPRGKVDLYSYTYVSGNGNGQLTYPVALLTADEVSLSGIGQTNTSARGLNSFLNSGSETWLLSPEERNKYGLAAEFFLRPDGELGSYFVNTPFGVRPAISLISGITPVSGSGIATDPWVVEPGPQLISFTVDGVSYQAVDGMTWRKWAESGYNTSDIVVEQYGRMWDDAQGKWVTRDLVNCGDVSSSELITANYNYELREPGPC